MKFQSALLRLIDVCAGLFGGLVALPVVLILGLAVRAGSPGPALFKQARLGRNERVFTLYKLRTMAVGTPNSASHEVSTSYVTPLGVKLRRFKLDELPQLWNVLIGDMSLVGPRPGLPHHVELTEARRREGVFDVRPGITGPAQIRDIDMSTPDLLAQTDREYAASPNLVAYVRCVLLTVVGRGQGDALGGR
ncbi:sugar transferase [Brevundimonas sp.]|jgi:O-antigen biosynthesis protein WbqP|uniref:sugar transferase n=1 Tax=Brevundimonas sp. TaxID=1871086 RepID=UPI002E142DD6|nr:sugar transferase [Brevundimonas sp.]